MIKAKGLYVQKCSFFKILFQFCPSLLFLEPMQGNNLKNMNLGLCLSLTEIEQNVLTQIMITVLHKKTLNHIVESIHNELLELRLAIKTLLVFI